MGQINPIIHESWKSILEDQFEAPYFSALKDFLISEKEKYPVYPPGKFIFNAFDSTPFNDLKVVILGQDPYHGPGQAHGLCFSVPAGIQPPPSLINIFKELHTDLDIPVPAHGNLESWARQGVFLLNATLTVRANFAGSHQGKGWEQFSDKVIQRISDKKEHVVFILWGKFALKKLELIDQDKHLVLTAAHPSPLSAHSGFFGCRHFSRTNDYLRSKGIREIDWKI